MIVLHDRGVSFTHVRKTGGSSITAALLKIQGKEVPEEEHGWQICAHNSGGMHTGYRHMPNIWSFGFMRNPFDVFMSLFNNWRQSTRIRQPKVAMAHRYSNPGDFAETFFTHPSYSLWAHWPQVRQLTCPVTRRTVDFIGRYETLEADWDVICQRCHFPPTPLGQLNRVPKPYVNRRLLTPSAVRLITSRWDADFRRGGYSYNPLEGLPEASATAP